MGGLTLAERIQELCPDCKIVFCTGYEEYAVEAFQLHVSGYLMKPISAQDIQKEIDNIKEKGYKPEKKKKLLTVKCFGGFEVYNADKTEMLSYGKVSEAKTGDITVELPDSVKNKKGNYVLRIFAEDVNSSAKNGLTDYSSNYVDIPFEVTTPHEWSYSGSRNVVTATCNDTDCEYHNNSLKLTLTASDKSYSGTAYNGVKLVNTITDITGEKASDITYIGRDGTKYEESTTAPTNAGTYTAKVKIGTAIASVNFSITKATINPSVGLEGWIYGEKANTPVVSGNTENADVTYSYKKKNAEDSAYMNITVEEMQNLPAGEYTLKATVKESANYEGQSATCNFVITKAFQNAPETVRFNPETIKGKEDGQIIGVTSAMEYRKDGDTEYTTISGTEITGLPAGTYFIRYKEDENHTASKETKVTITEGRQLKITVPEEQTGYELTVDKDTVDWHGEVKLTFKLKDGYSKTDEFAVMVNGEKVTLDDQNTYTISNLEEDADIKVIGVADTTAPTGTITVGENNWESFEKDITFDIFYKEKQNVRVTAQDNGSGVKNISYYVADEAMTKEEVEALPEESWTAYNNDNRIDLSDNGKYVVYAKITDNSGNTSYLSSNGMVIDMTAPVIEGIESGNTYTKSTEITVTDKNLATVSVDGEEVTLDENGKYILVPKDGTYTIVVTDKAGNTTTIENVTVNKEVPSVTAPTSQETLTYDGTERALVTAGQTTGGKLEYSLDGKNWSEKLPTAKNAGTYEVFYRVAGDTDYQDVEEKALTVTIAPKVIGITWSNTQFVYNGKTQQPTATATGILKGENCKITVKGGQKAVGKYIATASEVTNKNYMLPETGITTAFEIKAQQIKHNNSSNNDKNNSNNKNNNKKNKNNKNNSVTTPKQSMDRNRNTLLLNEGLKVSQTGKKINISWGKVQGAKGYDIYVQYCGKAFNAKSLNQVKTGRTAVIKGKTILVNAKKKPLSNKHTKTFRYASSNKKIATVSKKGKIKAVVKGKCTIYVYARNGYTKKVQVTVK